MGIKCYNKPNRTKTRHFSANDCGRIVCTAVKHGANRVDVWRKVEPCLGDPCEKVRVRAVISSVLEAATAIAIAVGTALAVVRLARVTLVLFLRVPVIRKYVLHLMGQTKRLEDAFLKARNITSEVQELERILLQRWGPP